MKFIFISLESIEKGNLII